MATQKDKALPTDPADQQDAVDAQLKEQKQDDTITVPASDAPGPANPEMVANLQTLIGDLERELASVNAELMQARAAAAPGEVEMDLETKVEPWVERVSGMSRKEIAGFVVLPGGEPSTSVLVIKDKDGREGHRFTFDNRLRSE